MVSFTGGTRIGSEVLVASAGRIGKCALELGGKSAEIFADDADLEASLPGVLGGMMPFSGQICTTRSRLLVSHKRHDEVVEAVIEGLRARATGDPQDPATTWGPLAVQRARGRVEALVEVGRREGAKVATGGCRPEEFDRGWFYEPTLFTGVDNSMRIAQEEAFGPMYCVIPYRDIDDAIPIANDSHLGLAGSIYTSDRALALDVARRVRSGTFAINSSSGAFTQPFGGMKQSGLGRECGLEDLYEYCDVKTISLA
jgi:aldehyde dehydrogenase (NAD+)